MAPQFDKALRQLLRGAGCTMVRQGRGSHEVWFSPVTRRSFSVPTKIPSRHTANAILRQAGYQKRFDSRFDQTVRCHHRGCPWLPVAGRGYGLDLCDRDLGRGETPEHIDEKRCSDSNIDSVNGLAPNFWMCPRIVLSGPSVICTSSPRFRRDCRRDWRRQGGRIDLDAMAAGREEHRRSRLDA